MPVGTFSELRPQGNSRAMGTLWFPGKRLHSLLSRAGGCAALQAGLCHGIWEPLQPKGRGGCPGRLGKGLSETSQGSYLYPGMLSFHGSFNMDKWLYCSKISLLHTAWEKALVQTMQFVKFAWLMVSSGSEVAGTRRRWCVCGRGFLILQCTHLYEKFTWLSFASFLFVRFKDL